MVTLLGAPVVKEEMRVERDYLHGLPMADKVHPHLPVASLYDLGSGSVIVEGMGRNDVSSIRTPAESQYVSGSTTSSERLRDHLFLAPVASPPDPNTAVVRLGGEILPDRVPRDPFH